MVQGKWLDKINWRFNAADYATILYAMSTAIWIMVFFKDIDDPGFKLIIRVFVIGFVILLFNIKILGLEKLLFFIKISYSSVLLVYWYGETAALNSVLFPPFDGILCQIDQQLFAYQPSIEFSQKYSAPIFSEIMYIGYFSYYVLNAISILLYFFYDKQETTKVVFIIIFSFFVYYWFFILFPSVGPQFYLASELRNVPAGLLFQESIRYLLDLGEEPTGAFPSSHVGMALIFMILIYRVSSKYFWVMVPVCVVLTFATVYIKAHYFIDVIGGIISGLLIYWFSVKVHHFVSVKTGIR